MNTLRDAFSNNVFSNAHLHVPAEIINDEKSSNRDVNFIKAIDKSTSFDILTIDLIIVDIRRTCNDLIYSH